LIELLLKIAGYKLL